MKHLALVLKKNNDGKTFIVMPLTSSANGSGINKYYVGNLACLPESLKNNCTYAVYNQIRTVNANRFIALKEGQNNIECKIDNDIYRKIIELGLREIVYSLSQDERLTIWKELYENEKLLKAKDIAYNIKSQSFTLSDSKRIDEMLKIKDLIHDIDYALDNKYINDGIEAIFEESQKL